MDEIRILLACGSGASSGFMAQSMRKAAAKKGIKARIEARSDSEIENYLDEIDLLLLGPHLKYIEAEYQRQAKEYNVPVACISQEAYGVLNGEKALDEALKIIDKNK